MIHIEGWLGREAAAHCRPTTPYRPSDAVRSTVSTDHAFSRVTWQDKYLTARTIQHIIENAKQLVSIINRIAAPTLRHGFAALLHSGKYAAHVRSRSCNALRHMRIRWG